MTAKLTVVVAQLDLFVGAIADNTERIIHATNEARDSAGADLILFPELTICGYPPEDLLFHGGFKHQVGVSLERLQQECKGISVMVGYPEYSDDSIFNAACLFRDGEIVARYRKICLPNYRVFDEKRYFKPGNQASVVDINGINAALTICEDVWEPGPLSQATEQGAQVILTINGSPYDLKSQKRREQVALQRVRETGLPLIYVNYTGGQDELVFDGGSFAMDASGKIAMRAPAFEEGLYVVTLSREAGQAVVPAGDVVPMLEPEASVYQAIVLGVRDYVAKHGFKGVVMGLSGGVDSALTLAIAVDALGADQVHTVMMPSRYTSSISLEDAAAQANTIGVDYHVISIDKTFECTLNALGDLFAGLPADATEENIQARCRGVILMAISNKTGRMLLTTGNKSEMAVGYATLYGDMAGGFAPIKDVSKSMVYRLARYRNRLSAVIPERVLTREPSAELAFDQKDRDTLPPYEVLDPILEAFIEDDCSVDEIVAKGFEREIVSRVLDMVKRSEYKRRQAPPGVRISSRAFGRDWRYPITSGYRVI